MDSGTGSTMTSVQKPKTRQHSCGAEQINMTNSFQITEGTIFVLNVCHSPAAGASWSMPHISDLRNFVWYRSPEK